MKIAGLDHVQLAMPPGGEDEARRFFGGILGMEEVAKPYQLSGRGGAWFRSGTTHIHMGIEEDFRPQTKAHPALITAELDELAVQLTGAGHRVEWDEALPGRRRLYTVDPFGNRIEFMLDGFGFSQLEEL